MLLFVRHTPLSQAELRRLRRQILPLARAFDLLHDQVIITDPDAHILYANAAVERSTGFARREILGKNPGDLWGGHMRNEFYRRMWKTIKSKGKAFSAEVRNTDATGRPIWQELRISPVLDARGRARFFVAIEQRIDERKLRQESRGDVISLLGHESLSPLTAIRWMLEPVAERPKLSRGERESLADIAKQRDRLFSILQDLLFLSREGKGHPPLETFALNAELSAIVKALEESHPLVRWHWGAPKERCLVRAVQSAAREVCTVMLESAAAIREAKGGGDVSVELAARSGVFVLNCTVAGKSSAAALQRLMPARIIAKYLGWKGPVETRRGTARTWSLHIPAATRKSRA